MSPGSQRFFFWALDGLQLLVVEGSWVAGDARSLTPRCPATCTTGLRHTNNTQQQHNNNNTIWGGSVLTGEEPPPHSGELKHTLSQAGGPTQSQLSRPVSSGHHISMGHRRRRKLLWFNEMCFKEKQEKKKKEETFCSTKKQKMENMKQEN